MWTNDFYYGHIYLAELSIVVTTYFLRVMPSKPRQSQTFHFEIMA
jgi:hypothetical protein